MKISFIVTTFNIQPYIRECLESLRPCLRPGDQVILVDDGSNDGTDDIVRKFVDEGGFGSGIRWTPIWLGTNTIGGLGIPANIGMDHAECEVIFFIDGGDYLIPDGFLKARRTYEAKPTDICFTDYLEFDQQAGRVKPPADAQRWDKLDSTFGPEEVRLAALALIAVPWRKFYRRSFLLQHRIRFPEGDFFFEDNPVHWQVCLLAESISFSRNITCHHRVNRTGQTMTSTGVELAAFFAHFQTIRAGLPQQDDVLRLQSARWLIGNMSWHIPRLHQSAFFLYANRAHEVLKQIADDDWQALALEMSDSMIWHYADRLRQGGTWDVIEAWRSNDDRVARSRLDRDIRDLGNRLQDLERQVKTAREILQAQQAIDEFSALQEISPLDRMAAQH